MEGSYQLMTDTGEPFDARIDAFTLACPEALNSRSDRGALIRSGAAGSQCAALPLRLALGRAHFAALVGGMSQSYGQAVRDAGGRTRRKEWVTTPRSQH